MYCLNFGAFSCYVAVALSAFAFALVELLLRFKAGNEIKVVVFGEPQSWYYAINMLFACSVFFGSEALETTKLTELAQSNIAAAIVKSGGLALAALVAARSSFGGGIASSGTETPSVWGPGVLVGKLLAIVDERIEQKRFIKMTPKLTKLAEKCPPDFVYGFVLPYLFLQSERRAGPAEKEITNKLQGIESLPETSPYLKSLLMLTALGKEFGSECLTAVEKLREEHQAGGVSPTETKLNAMKAQSDRLNKLLEQLLR